MKNLEAFEKKYLEKIKETKKIPDFNSGDTVIVYVKVKEKKEKETRLLREFVYQRKTPA